jgi:adenylyltransferase/sulfurtransferase
VLVVGAGGLGSPALLYLAAAGVGALGIVDDDAVSLSNLQRQVLHGTEDIGRPKVESAARALARLNPDVAVEPHALRMDAGSAAELVPRYDLVLDGCDNFPTRYLVNAACVAAGRPLISAAMSQWEGQIAVFHPAAGGPCYRCLFPEPTPAELAPSCDEAGVLGVLPGIVGLIQATEAVKLLLGRGRPLLGRLLTCDALEMTFREYEIARDPACPACGERPTIREVKDLEWSCHVGAPRGEAATARP